MFIPDPFAMGAIKVALYCGLGAAVRVRGRRRGNPIGFGVTRAALGWVVGSLVIVALMQLAPESSDFSDAALVAFLAIPRLALSGFLIKKFFDPRGGWPEMAIWALFSVVLASAVDIVVFKTFEDIDWLRAGWC